MNSIRIKQLAGLSRVIPVAIATFFCVATSNAAPSKSVTVPLAGKAFGVGKNLKVSSGTGRIVAANAYNYKLSGSCQVTGDIAPWFQPNITFDAFLDQIRPGTSALLSKTVKNTKGTLPATLLSKTVKGTKKVNGVDVVISVDIKIHILAGGMAQIELANVKVESVLGTLSGKVQFGDGSKVVVKKAA